VELDVTAEMREGENESCEPGDDGFIMVEDAMTKKRKKIVERKKQTRWGPRRQQQTGFVVYLTSPGSVQKETTSSSSYEQRTPQKSQKNQQVSRTESEYVARDKPIVRREAPIGLQAVSEFGGNGTRQGKSAKKEDFRRGIITFKEKVVIPDKNEVMTPTPANGNVMTPERGSDKKQASNPQTIEAEEMKGNEKPAQQGDDNREVKQDPMEKVKIYSKQILMKRLNEDILALLQRHRDESVRLLPFRSLAITRLRAIIQQMYSCTTSFFSTITSVRHVFGCKSVWFMRNWIGFGE
jgi:hypothetical protein